MWPLSVGVPVKCTSTAALATPILDWRERPEHQQFTTWTYINLFLGPWFRVLFVFPCHHKSGVPTTANLRDGRMYSANKLQKVAEWCHITPTPLPPYAHEQILTTVCICHVCCCGRPLFLSDSYPYLVPVYGSAPSSKS